MRGASIFENVGIRFISVDDFISLPDEFVLESFSVWSNDCTEATLGGVSLSSTFGYKMFFLELLISKIMLA